MANPVPREVCWRCGEFCPHYCAALVTFRRARWTGRRVVTIIDRAAGLSNDAPEGGLGR